MSACLERLEPAGGVGVLADVVGVAHRGADRADPLVGPDRVQQALERRELPLGEHRHAADHLVEDVPLRLVAQEVAGDLLHRDQADPALVGGVDRLVERRVLVEPGAILEHDRVDDPALGRRLDQLGAVLVVGRDADEPGLARLLGRLRRLLQLLALDHGDGVVERVVVAEAVDEEQVDVVGPERRQPLVEHPHELGGGLGRVLGDEEDLLADRGVLLRTTS